MKSAYVPGLVFALLGLPFLAWGGWLAVERLAIVASWPEAPAVVASSAVETRGSNHAARITVRFETPDGPIATVAEHDNRTPAMPPPPKPSNVIRAADR